MQLRKALNQLHSVGENLIEVLSRQEKSEYTICMLLRVSIIAAMEELLRCI